MWIYILEGEPQTRELFTAWLGAVGFPASVTKSSEEALEQIRAGRPSVLLADPQMPEADGAAFLDAALQTNPNATLIMVAGGYAAESRDFCELPPPVLLPDSDHPGEVAAWQPLPLRDVRRQHILRVLEMCGGNRVRASEILGIGRTSLYRFLKRQSRRRAAPTAA